MALKKKINKDGTYYWRFEVFKRRNPVTNKQEYYPTKNFKRQKGWTDKRYDKEASKAYAVYESQCKEGLILSKEEQKYQEMQLEIERQKRKTFGEFIQEDFMPYKKSEVDLTTYSNYTTTIKVFNELNDILITDITTKDMQEFINGLKNRYANSSINAIIKLTKSIFKYAIKLNLIDKSPMDNVSAPKMSKAEQAVQKGKIQEKRLTPTQYDNLMEYLKHDDPLYRALIKFMADSGARIGEVIALKWENINIETGETYICGNVQYIPKYGNYIKCPKNGYNRTVYLTVESLPEMRKWKQEQCPPSEWCFPSPLNPNKNISARGVQTHFAKISKLIGLEKFHPHMLRHTCASRWLEYGIPLQVVANRLGHQNINITSSIYSHGSSEADKKAAEIWNQSHKASE